MDTLSHVNVLYAKVRAIQTDARHIVAACRIPHRQFHTHEDFFDDDEHSGGAFLLNMLVESEIHNRAVFIMRLYDGTHIGNKRYDAMREAVKSAIDAAPPNRITNVIDCIWQQSKETNTGSGIRGRGSNRRFRGSGRGSNHTKSSHIRADKTYVQIVSPTNPDNPTPRLRYSDGDVDVNELNQAWREHYQEDGQG